MSINPVVPFISALFLCSVISELWCNSSAAVVKSPSYCAEGCELKPQVLQDASAWHTSQPHLLLASISDPVI